MKFTVVLAALAFVLSACGGDAAPGTTIVSGAPAPEVPATPPTTAAAPATSVTAPDIAPGPTATTAATPSTSESPTTTSTPTTTMRQRPDGEDAPDFTLELGQGDSFTLSLEQKPVYMVFWAEW